MHAEGVCAHVCFVCVIPSVREEGGGGCWLALRVCAHIFKKNLKLNASMKKIMRNQPVSAAWEKVTRDGSVCKSPPISRPNFFWLPPSLSGQKHDRWVCRELMIF